MDDELEDIIIKEDPETINKSFMPELQVYQWVLVSVVMAAVVIITLLFYRSLSPTLNCLLCIVAVFLPGYAGFYKYRGLDFVTVSRKRKRMQKYAFEPAEDTKKGGIR